MFQVVKRRKPKQHHPSRHLHLARAAHALSLSPSTQARRPWSILDAGSRRSSASLHRSSDVNALHETRIRAPLALARIIRMHTITGTRPLTAAMNARSASRGFDSPANEAARLVPRLRESTRANPGILRAFPPHEPDAPPRPATRGLECAHGPLERRAYTRRVEPVCRG